MNRLIKQMLYGGIFLIVVGGVVWFGYRQIVPVPVVTPTPIPIQPLVNHGAQIISYGNGSYDVVAQLENTNAAYGAARVDTTLVVSDAAGKELARENARAYVNPKESRYLVFSFAGLAGVPAKAELQFAPAQVQWGAFRVDQSGAVAFPLSEERLQVIPGGTTYEATVTNHSSFDFDRVDVTVLLYDNTGMLVGAGATTLNTLVAEQARAFVVQWPFAVSSAVQAKAFVTTNLFDNANYIRTYGSQERFQGF